MNSFIRFIISLCVAVVLVGMVALFGVTTYFDTPPVSQVKARPVERATADELEWLRRSREPAPPAAIVTPPERQRDGFVQLQFDVTPDGRARDVIVLGAMPAGYFEDQAIGRVAARRYVPDRRDGVPVTTRRTEIVEFKYTPTTSADAPTQNP